MDIIQIYKEYKLVIELQQYRCWSINIYCNKKLIEYKKIKYSSIYEWFPM